MIKRLWHHNRTALIAFAVALAALGFFGFRTATSMMYWMDPAHQNQALEGWMTPRYVSMSYKIPPEMLAPVLLLEQGDPKRQSLDAIMADTGLSMEDLQARIDAAAAAFRAQQGARND